MPEHGEFPLHLQGPPHNTLIVTCNDYIAALSLGTQDEKMFNFPVTHDTQLCSAIYNKFLKQVGLVFIFIALSTISSSNRKV